jgi:uncharacterized membrane protein YbhN (UPF0104 family)
MDIFRARAAFFLRRRLADRPPHAIREKLHTILEHIILGAGFGLMTVVIWSNDAIFIVLAARTIDLKIEVTVAYLLLAGLGLASALPSTPGYVGIYQFVAVSVLVPFGMSRTDAVGYILLAQALQYLVVGGWGTVGFWKFRRATIKVDAARHDPAA